MKQNHLLIPLFILLLVFQSCGFENEGPVGPPGLQGPEGPVGAAGDSGFLFEYENVNFTGPDYEVFLDYPEDFEGLETDVTLIYFLWDVQTDSNGEPLDVWRQVPQTIMTENGLLIYNFDYTKIDVRLFLQADFDLNELTAIYTDDWVVRVVIVPANFWNGRVKNIDFSDYFKVEEAFGLPQITKSRLNINRVD